MKRIYSEPSPIFIHQIKELLEDKGIKTILKNELLSGGVGELPPTEVWPELWVLENDDEEPAKSLVEAFVQSTKTQAKEWQCNNCGEQVGGQFNICWNCGGEKQ